MTDGEWKEIHWDLFTLCQTIGVPALHGFSVIVSIENMLYGKEPVHGEARTGGLEQWLSDNLPNPDGLPKLEVIKYPKVAYAEWHADGGLGVYPMTHSSGSHYEVVARAEAAIAAAEGLLARNEG